MVTNLDFDLFFIHPGPEKSRFMRQKKIIYNLFRSGSSFCVRGIFSGSVNQKVSPALNVFYSFSFQFVSSHINIFSLKNLFINLKLCILFTGLIQQKTSRESGYFQQAYFSEKINNQTIFLITCKHNSYGTPGKALFSCVTKSNGRRIYFNIKAANVRLLNSDK